MSIAKRLIEARGKKTREEVANSVGITLSALGNYENGLRIPRDEIKVKLAKFYGVSVEFLFFDQECHE